MDQLSYYTLTVESDKQFEIAIQDAPDTIGQQIISHTYAFSPSFRLLFSFMRPGQIVIDLGAHLGTFTLAAAALGCRVIAVEAAPSNVELLKASIAQNKFDNVSVVPAAASDHSGTVKFSPHGPFGTICPADADGIIVPAITVDELVTQFELPRVDFIKMDIEGAEVAAIAGMSRLLTRSDAPSILYESNGHTLHLFAHTPQHLMAALEQFGYSNYLVEPNRLVLAKADDVQPECVVDYWATKKDAERLHNWQITPPASTEESITKILASCRMPTSAHRAYMARTLATGNPTILSDLRVVRALSALTADPDADVRAAAAWFIQRQKEENPNSLALHKVTTGEHRLIFTVRSRTIDADIVNGVMYSPCYRDVRFLLGAGSRVIDVGAHIGSFSVLAAACGASVCAVEPIPANYTLLEENIRLNGFPGRIKPLNAAVWSSTGERTMHIAVENTGGSGFYYHDHTTPEVSVHCFQLEDLMNSEGIATCDLLKLDCEGSEFEILNALSPEGWGRIKAIVAEYHRVPGYSPNSLFDLLTTHGFLVYNQPLDMGGGLGYLLAVQPPSAPVLLPPVQISSLESPLTRLPLVGRLWRMMRKPIHGLIVFYLNQFVTAYNRQQRQTYVYLQVLAQQMLRRQNDHDN